MLRRKVRRLLVALVNQGNATAMSTAGKFFFNDPFSVPLNGVVESLPRHVYTESGQRQFPNSRMEHNGGRVQVGLDTRNVPRLAAGR